MKRIWLTTGVSGSGRIEFLKELEKTADQMNLTVHVFDIGTFMEDECKRLKISLPMSKILDVDDTLLSTIRSLALKEVVKEINQIDDSQDCDIFIGIHGLFWRKHKLIPGVSYQDLRDMHIYGIINIVDSVLEIQSRNRANPNWGHMLSPSNADLQRWMCEEEFVSKILADILNAEYFCIARGHNVRNFIELLRFPKCDRKKIYLSYPITAIRQENPEQLEQFQNETLPKLEEHFIVFNPLTILDMGQIGKILKEDDGEAAAALVKSRTIQRDYRFIDQADAVVVYYGTEKNSPGVLAEIYYAYRTAKPVFIYYPHATSPFLEEAVTFITDNIDKLTERLEEYAKS